MSRDSIIRIRYQNDEAEESARLDIYDESDLPGLDKTIAIISSCPVNPLPAHRMFMPLTTEQCRKVAFALCSPGEIASEWQDFISDAEALLTAPETKFRDVFESLKCAVEMLREASLLCQGGNQ